MEYFVYFHINKVVVLIGNWCFQLDNLKSQCADVDTEMSLDEATSKQTDLRQKLSTLRTRVKTSQKKLNIYNKKLQTMTDKKNKIKEELLNVQKKVCIKLYFSYNFCGCCLSSML